MFDRAVFAEAIPVVGVDLCFSNLDANSLYATHAQIRDSIRYTNLARADWFWAAYGSTIHIVALHDPIELPAALIPDLQEMVYDTGVDIAALMGSVREMPTQCEGMEFYFQDCGITHSPERMHRILPPYD